MLEIQVTVSSPTIGMQGIGIRHTYDPSVISAISNDICPATVNNLFGGLGVFGACGFLVTNIGGAAGFIRPLSTTTNGPGGQGAQTGGFILTTPGAGQANGAFFELTRITYEVVGSGSTGDYFFLPGVDGEIPIGGGFFFPDVLSAASIIVGPILELLLAPLTDENPVGTPHTVTASVSDDSGQAQAGVPVAFAVTEGPNAGEASDPGECAPNANCTTDASGAVSWTYVDAAGLEQCDSIDAGGTDPTTGQTLAPKDGPVQKCWFIPPNTLPVASCFESTNPSGRNTPPNGNRTSNGRGAPPPNPDAFYELIGDDAEDGTAPLFVTTFSGAGPFGPFSSGSVVKVTEAPGTKPKARNIGGPQSAVAAHLILDDDALVFAVDSSGAESPTVECTLPPTRPACGIGFELALLLPAVVWVHRRRR